MHICRIKDMSYQSPNIFHKAYFNMLGRFIPLHCHGEVLRNQR